VCLICFLLLWNIFKQVKKQPQYLQLSLMKELVQSFASTMDTMQKTNQAFMLEMIKAYTLNPHHPSAETENEHQRLLSLKMSSHQLIGNLQADSQVLSNPAVVPATWAIDIGVHDTTIRSLNKNLACKALALPTIVVSNLNIRSAGTHSNHREIHRSLRTKFLLHWLENKMIVFWARLATQTYPLEKSEDIYTDK